MAHLLMAHLYGALLLAVPSGIAALSFRDRSLEDPDPWVRNCKEKAIASQRDELDYGPCFDEEEVKIAMRGAQFVGRNSSSKDPSSKIATSMFTEVDILCDTIPRPLSDRDERLGAGNPACRYEPSEEDLRHYAEKPADIAIVIPSNYDKDSNVSDDPSDHYPLFLGVLTWKKYARYHGYAFYSGPPAKSCPELEGRHPAWTKPCMAMGLIKKHKYLIMVDRDTTVIKPRLRLEPLFAMAGLMDKHAKKVLAVAEEWGSCKKGVRSPLSGDVNTGIVLVKQSPAAEEALASWFYGPTWCKGVTAEPIARPGWWPFQGEPCQGCSCITRGIYKWSFDQIGFYASVADNNTFRSMVTVFRPGCPINSPFADFIPHLVSGTPTKAAYDVNHREVISTNLHACNSKLMDSKPGQGNPYERCSICDALPEGFHPHSDSWSLSCRSHSRAPR
mmetsp:Transcript_102160/g.266619  ORF Transcript_102160/g.266619 Transcript_102160/m.266619 type:complete len:446 (-) Transcript_102160:92-1429(-)